MPVIPRNPCNNCPQCFLDLCDTPNTYDNAHGYFLRVKYDGTGIEFVPAQFNANSNILYFETLNQLENYDTINLPDRTIAYCRETNYFYVLIKNNITNPDFGFYKYNVKANPSGVWKNANVNVFYFSDGINNNNFSTCYQDASNEYIIEHDNVIEKAIFEIKTPNAKIKLNKNTIINELIIYSNLNFYKIDFLNKVNDFLSLNIKKMLIYGNAAEINFQEIAETTIENIDDYSFQEFKLQAIGIREFVLLKIINYRKNIGNHFRIDTSPSKASIIIGNAYIKSNVIISYQNANNIEIKNLILEENTLHMPQANNKIVINNAIENKKIFILKKEASPGMGDISLSFYFRVIKTIISPISFYNNYANLMRVFNDIYFYNKKINMIPNILNYAYNIEDGYYILSTNNFSKQIIMLPLYEEIMANDRPQWKFFVLKLNQNAHVRVISKNYNQPFSNTNNVQIYFSTFDNNINNFKDYVRIEIGDFNSLPLKFKLYIWQEINE